MLPSAHRDDAERQRRLLTDINIDDMLGAVGIDPQQNHPLLRRVFHGAAERFARHVIGYDNDVAALGLQRASQRMLQSYVPRIDITGLHHIPQTGPVLLVSNHPGLYDTVALFASIPRTDLRTVAAERPFLTALPHISSHLIYIPEVRGRLSVLRAMASHLKSGGAILTFPGGKIEPDPAVSMAAGEALDAWSGSLEVLARFIPDLAIVPLILSNIISRRALHHPITRLRRTQHDREWLGAIMQLQFASLRTDYVRLMCGPPIVAQALPDGTTVAEAVIATARTLINASEQAAVAQQAALLPAKVEGN